MVIIHILYIVYSTQFSLLAAYCSNNLIKSIYLLLRILNLMNKFMKKFMNIPEAEDQHVCTRDTVNDILRNEFDIETAKILFHAVLRNHCALRMQGGS